ncbi:uncharacterized protein LOC126927972, partial [Bombus affinis]|uniref:uncharacterized protein LOC126927972 n=1 Tax=Bombus affinis TaxID=309941 RepID=UPI0021B835AF
VPDILPHQELDIRPCKTVQRFREFTLNKKVLKLIKVLGQINNELIVGLITKNNMKMLLLMDQHAIHERIRYEHLLYGKALQKSYKNPIVFHQIKRSYNHTTSCDVVDNNTVMIRAVPECLRKNKYYHDELKLKLKVQNLLNELVQNFSSYDSNYATNILPSTIHNAIAMEACHDYIYYHLMKSILGAIKFGDSLSLKECKRLLKLLNKTKIPTQCAHGRPSIIPLLELTDLERRHIKIVRVSNTFFVCYILNKGKLIYRFIHLQQFKFCSTYFYQIFLFFSVKLHKSVLH